jgi:phage repressor protein C with HTH and peptisase S24 domain
MYSGKEDAATAAHLKSGETCLVTGYGNSMTPKLASGEVVIMEPVTDTTNLEKGDIVLCKVNGHYYCHLISAIKGTQYQISNNHKHVNGWISKKNIFGRMIGRP